MFTNLQIPKKIALSFACILVTTLVMTVVILMANRNIASSADNVDRDNAVVQQATEMEMQLLRMNSQMRGFSITADEKYLEQYYDGQERSIAAAAELEKILPTATERDLASQSSTLARIAPLLDPRSAAATGRGLPVTSRIVRASIARAWATPLIKRE